VAGVVVGIRRVLSAEAKAVIAEAHDGGVAVGEDEVEAGAGEQGNREEGGVVSRQGMECEGEVWAGADAGDVRYCVEGRAYDACVGDARVKARGICTGI